MDQFEDQFLAENPEALGLNFEDEALELFVLSTGGDSGVVANELEKLALYGPRGAITVEQVRALVPISRAAVIFELGNALARRDATLALSLVRDLLDQGETAIGILLATLLPTIRNLLLAKDLMERHRLPRPQAPFSFISTLNRLPANMLPFPEPIGSSRNDARSPLRRRGRIR